MPTRPPRPARSAAAGCGGRPRWPPRARRRPRSAATRRRRRRRVARVVDADARAERAEQDGRWRAPMPRLPPVTRRLPASVIAAVELRRAGASGPAARMAAPCRSSRSRGSKAAGRAPRRGAWPRPWARTPCSPRSRAAPPSGRAIRGLLLDHGHEGMTPAAEVLLFFADRAQHVAEVVRPGAGGRPHVVSDRYTDSSLAYQGYGRGIDLELIRAVAARWPRAACGRTSRSSSTCPWTSASPGWASAAATTGWRPRSASSTSACARAIATMAAAEPRALGARRRRGGRGRGRARAVRGRGRPRAGIMAGHGVR